MNATDAVFYVAILIMSVVIHEISHGFMAERFGDKTARYAGRLTLNPIKHLDLFGSILLPALLIISKVGFVFGWAKPVPYNPNNLSNRKWGTIAVASAGVMANFFIAIVFGLMLRIGLSYSLPDGFYFIVSAITLVNIGLGVFNLIPIAPLDGSRILVSFLPASFERWVDSFERYSIFLLIIFVIYFSHYLYPVVGFIYRSITGMPI